MRAVVFTGAGGNEVVSVEERPAPEPGPEDVVVRVDVRGSQSCRPRTTRRQLPCSAGQPAGCSRSRGRRNGGELRGQSLVLAPRRPRVRTRRRWRARRPGGRTRALRDACARRPRRARSGSGARGVHHRARRGVHASGPAPRRDAARPRCGRRRRHGRGSARRSGRRTRRGHRPLAAGGGGRRCAGRGDRPGRRLSRRTDSRERRRHPRARGRGALPRQPRGARAPGTHRHRLGGGRERDCSSVCSR